MFPTLPQYCFLLTAYAVKLFQGTFFEAVASASQRQIPPERDHIGKKTGRYDAPKAAPGNREACSRTLRPADGVEHAINLRTNAPNASITGVFLGATDHAGARSHWPENRAASPQFPTSSERVSHCHPEGAVRPKDPLTMPATLECAHCGRQKRVKIRCFLRSDRSRRNEIT